MEFHPRILFWETTKRCNLRCGYCRMLKNTSAVELSTPRALQLLAEIKTAFGSPLVVLSGGEPLLREDIFEIISHARQIGLPTALATNGVMLDEQSVVQLRKHGVRRVSISLDATDEQAHDASRGVAGAFRKTLDAAALLRKHHVPFQINYTLTQSNYRQMRMVADLALSIGAAAVHYFVLVPVGCGKQVEQSAMLGAEESEQAIAEIRVLADALPIEIRPTCAPQYLRFAGNSHGSGCLAGTAAFFISADADIYPCGYLPVRAGSLATTSLKDIWESAPVFRELRQNNLKGGCGACELKDTCRGCRARAFGMGGDYLAAEVTCALAKEVMAV